MQTRLIICALALVTIDAFTLPSAQAADEYWNTNGTSATWTAINWGTSAAGPFNNGWTANNDANFTADSLITFVTNTQVGNVTITDGKTVTLTAAGTYSTNGNIRTMTIGTGSTLIWNDQAVSSAAGTGFIKNGAGTWNIGNMGSGSAPGGFTLNAGTVITNGNNGLGNGLLTINGGTWESSSTRDYNPSGIAIGGDFTLTGTGNAILAKSAGGVALGGSTRTITNSTASGSRQFTGIISGGSGAGLTFAGAGGAQIYIGNTSNTFDGPITINGGEVVFNGNGAFGSTTSITIDGGRLTMGSMTGSGTVSALTAATIASSRNIFVGASAGTSISVSDNMGVTTYNGVIADKTGATGAWAKQGAGRLELGGVSTYTGNTAINNGTLRLTTGNNRLPTGTTVSLGQSASANLGTFDLNGFSQQIAGLNSTTGTNATTSNNTVTSSTAATLTLGGSGTYSYGDGTNANSGVITGSISLVKGGSGTQTLGDANIYTGTTQVNGGTLLINGNQSSATGAVSISNSGTVLGGTGTIGGAITVNSAAVILGGTGAAASGTLTVANNLTLNSGSIIELALGASGAHSTLARTAGTWTFDATQAFTFIDLGAQTGTYDNIITGLAGDPGTEANWTITNLGFTGTFSFDGANIDLTLTTVPEPSTWVAGALALGVLGWSQRRRLRSLILHRA